MLPDDKIVYSCLINAALECRKPQVAAGMLECLDRVLLESKDYILHFRTYSALADVPSAEAAEHAFRKLGDSASNLQLNLVLLAWVNAKHPEKAGELLLEGHTLQGADDSIVDVVSYNTVLKGFARASLPRRCFDFVRHMREHGLEPDNITCSTVLEVCVSDTDVNLVEDFVDCFDGQSMNLKTAAIFMKAFARAGCFTKALMLHEKFFASHSSIDLSACSIIIKMLVDAGQFRRGVRLMDQMESAAGALDDGKLAQMLESCRYLDDLARGQRIYSHAVQLGVQPSEYSLAMMLKLHGRCGANAEAYEIVANWEKLHGAHPSVIHFTCLMNGCVFSKQYDLAWQTYELMQKRGVVLDATALSTLLPALSAARRWDRCVILTRRALHMKPSIRVPIEMLSTVRSQLAANGAPPALVSEWQQLMQECRQVSEACTG